MSIPNVTIGPYANDQITTIKNCVAIGHNAQAWCCDGAIAVGDNTVATLEHPHVIGNMLFGRLIPDDVKKGFESDPKSAIWMLKTAALFIQAHHFGIADNDVI